MVLGLVVVAGVDVAVVVPPGTLLAAAVAKSPVAVAVTTVVGEDVQAVAVDSGRAVVGDVVENRRFGAVDGFGVEE